MTDHDVDDHLKAALAELTVIMVDRINQLEVRMLEHFNQMDARIGQLEVRIERRFWLAVFVQSGVIIASIAALARYIQH